MERLPDEVLLCVFSYLSLEDIYKCSLVCQRWNVICKDSSLWRTIILDFQSDSQVPDRILSAIAKSHPCVQNVSFRYGRMCSKEHPDTVARLLYRSFEMLSQLKSFSIEGTPPYPLNWPCVVHVCGQTLTECTVEGNDSFGSRQFSLLFRNSNLRLQTLSLAHCRFLDATDMFNTRYLNHENFNLCLGSLAILNLDGIYDMPDVTLTKFFVASPKLKSLTLDGERISDLTPQNVAHMLPLLEHFSISFCDALTNVSLLSIARLKHLESLYLKRNKVFTSEGFQQIFRRRPARLPSGEEVGVLKRFSVDQCVNGFDDSALSCLAENSPELRYLDVSWCWQVTDFGIHSLSVNCCKIQVLRLVGLDCPCSDVIDNPMPTLRVLDLQQSGRVDDSKLEQLKATKPWIDITDHWGNSMNTPP